MIKVTGGHRWKRKISRALSLVLSAALLVSGYSIPVYAEPTVSTGDVVSPGDETVLTGEVTQKVEKSVSLGDAAAGTIKDSVSANDMLAALRSLPSGNETYDQFTEDKLMAEYSFGVDITADSIYKEETGFGFVDVEYNDAAKGWDGGVYYPRAISKSAPGASNVAKADECLAVASTVWTETESTGFGVYTYENTSAFSMRLAPADYKVEVTLVNPTSNAYTAYLEAEDITKVSNIAVEAGKEVTSSFIAVLVDGVLDLKFLVNSDATSKDSAATQTAYVSNVKVTRLATQEQGSKPTIFVASDSTVQSYNDNEYPKTGWGQTLFNFFGKLVEERECENCGYSQSQTYETENVIIENRAIGGRSSKSFVEEGKLDDLLEDIKPGDYLFVQWGHNDATAARPLRYVSPADFGKWIQYYVDGALQRGATPVLVTPVARYSYDTKNNTFVGNFEAYGDVMRTMGAEQSIPVIDLTKSSVALCNAFGVDGAKSLFMMFDAGEWTNYPGGSNDQTHLQYYGAYKFAQCVAKGIKENAALSALAEKIKMQLPEEAPAAVTGLKSLSVGASSVTMTWDAAANAEMYYVYRAVLESGKTIEDVDFSTADKYSVAVSNKYTDSTCEAGVTYVYAVRGFNEKGLGGLSDKIQVTTKSAGWKFDFNYKNSVTLEGWTGINHDNTYSAELGYGFTTTPNNGRDRGVVESIPDSVGELGSMGRDFVLGASVFEVVVPNGDYEVTCFAADMIAGGSTIKSNFTAEGKAIGQVSAKQSLGKLTATVRVTDGKLTIGNDGYMTGLTITEVQKAPSGLSVYERTVVSNDLQFGLNFNTVDGAVSYNVYRKGISDDKFQIVKSFTVEDLKANELSCKQQTAKLGESYEYYMTAVVADGSESAPSETITVETVLKGVAKPAAPANVKCTDPTSDKTELQHTITITWDAVPSVVAGDTADDENKGKEFGPIYYNIYRSAKAEDEKGFSGYEKVGSSNTTSFTDKDEDIATNINYYYKVTAVNAGGEGEKSAACKTPAVGTLVAGGLEKYSDRALVAMDLAGKDGGSVNVSATDAAGNEYTQGVYVSWRSYEADFDKDNNLSTTFTVYRNDVQIAANLKVTNLVDPAGKAGDTYRVVGSNDAALEITAKNVKVWENKYLELNLQCPADDTMPDGSKCTYSANDMSVGDLDGDGVLELIVKWYPSNAKDNSGSGYTGKTFIDGYDIDYSTGNAELLWRIDMGVNIRSGAHYTQFQVWDYDGDGKAEIAVKAADGTTTFKNTANGLVETAHIGACSTADLPIDKISAKNDYRNSTGYVLDGPEYFAMFNGEDGSLIDSVDYTPARGSVGAWGDAYGNRVDRFLSATAYLNGETPFAVFCRGYYTRTCLTAYYLKDTDDNGIGDEIATYWTFDSLEAGSEYEAQGNHGIAVNDVDNDGKDEIIYGALTIDHDGTAKYCTGLGHGDAMHISDWIPWNDGLEIMSVHEHDNVAYHVEVHDAETGEVLMGYNTGKDTGRGVASDIDPTAVGGEWWSIASPTYESNDEPEWDSTDGEVYAAASTLAKLVKLSNSTPASNATLFWDGDLLSEIQDHTFDKVAYAPIGVVLSKWNYETEKQEQLLFSEEIWSSNGTKGNLGLIADILGDWREEIIARCSEDANKVRIYSTTIQTDYVVPCLLENLAYREGVAWENVGYNQPANLSYLLSEGLVTAQLSEGKIEAESAEIIFTEANDGKLYGHTVEGYEVYRAPVEGENAGVYEKITTLKGADLKEYNGSAEKPDTSAEPAGDEILFSENFEGEKHAFALIASGNTANEYWEKDTSTVNTNASNHVYGVGSRSGGDTGTQNAEAFGIQENVTVAFELKMDACAGGKSSTYALLGEKNKTNWISSGKQILTFTGSATDNGYWSSITVNGVDITKAANVSAGTKNGESSGKGGLNRDTTGWLKVNAELDFTAQKVGLTITRISDGSEVYKGEVPFVNEVSSLEYIFFAGAKQYGGVFTDNIMIVKKADKANAEEEKPATELKKEVKFSENFEGEKHAFALIASGNTANEYWEKDTSTVNTNASNHVYGVGSRSGGDTGTQNAEAFGIQENVTVAFELKMDACAGGKSSTYALLGEKNKTNWISSGKQILTFTGSATDNGYWSSITVNGVDITKAANVSAGTKNGESSGKGGLNRDTTGWLKVNAELDFTAQKVGLTITRISDGSEVYKGEVPFVNEVSSLEYIFFAGAKQYGGVFTDNIEIYTEKEVAVTPEPGEGDNTTVSGPKTYVYTDTNLKPATKYSYKIAAVVDGKTSYMSRALEIETADKIESVAELAPITLVKGTPVAEGETAASLLTPTVKVTTQDGAEKEYAVNWDITEFDINTVGEYTLKGTIKGWSEQVELKVTVKENEVKGYVPFEELKVIVGNEVTLPEEVEIEWTNTTITTKKITWDTASLDTNTIGEYTLQATVADSTDTVEIVVKVVADYIVSVDKTYTEVSYLSADVLAQLPEKVTAVYASGARKDVTVTWNTDSVAAVDTGKIGKYTVSGSVEGFEGEVAAEVTVANVAVYKFDFGIKAGEVAEGWTGITVNPKGGKETFDKLGVTYSAEKGYGFLNGSASIEGRSEDYTQAGVLPKVVYKDFAIPDGQTFVVDLPNGTYEVVVVGGSVYKSNVKATIEGTAVSVGNSAGTYTATTYTVEVKDGQLTCNFTAGSTSRLDAIIIRQTKCDKTALKTAIDAAKELEGEEKLYTEETWSAFAQAAVAAEELYAESNPSVVAMEKARAALVNAQNALQKISVTPDPDPTPDPKPTPDPVPDESKELVSDVSEITPTQLMAVLNNVPALVEKGIATVEKLISFLKTDIAESEEAKTILNGIDPKNTKTLEITVYVYENGVPVREATAADFDTGIKVTIPYEQITLPVGTNYKDYDFVVGHMFTKDYNGNVPGEIEYLKPEKTEQGLEITITSASPFTVAWKAVESSESSNDDTTPEINNQEQKAGASVSTQATKTGDNMNVAAMIWCIVLLAAVAGVGVMVVLRKRKMNGGKNE